MRCSQRVGHKIASLSLWCPRNARFELQNQNESLPLTWTFCLTVNTEINNSNNNKNLLVSFFLLSVDVFFLVNVALLFPNDNVPMQHTGWKISTVHEIKDLKIHSEIFTFVNHEENCTISNTEESLCKRKRKVKSNFVPKKTS